VFDGSIESALPVIAVCAVALGGLCGVTTRRGLGLILLGSFLSMAPELGSHVQHWLVASKRGGRL
jgi:hypothetical protein